MDLLPRICACSALLALNIVTLVAADECVQYGHTCSAPYECCGTTCCIPTDIEHQYHTHLHWSVWNMWYFWFVVLFILMSCFGGCSYYRRHQLMLARQQNVTDGSYSGWRFPPSFPVSLFAGYTRRHRNTHDVVAVPQECPPPTRTMFVSPPPYSEVVSQPTVYPPNKDYDLPPYPGSQPAYAMGLPPYSGPIPHLPPYSAREDDDSQLTEPLTQQQQRESQLTHSTGLQVSLPPEGHRTAVGAISTIAPPRVNDTTATASQTVSQSQ